MLSLFPDSREMLRLLLLLSLSSLLLLQGSNALCVPRDSHLKVRKPTPSQSQSSASSQANAPAKPTPSQSQSSGSSPANAPAKPTPSQSQSSGSSPANAPAKPTPSQSQSSGSSPANAPAKPTPSQSQSSGSSAANAPTKQTPSQSQSSGSSPVNAPAKPPPSTPSPVTAPAKSPPTTPSPVNAPAKPPPSTPSPPNAPTKPSPSPPSPVDEPTQLPSESVPSPVKAPTNPTGSKSSGSVPSHAPATNSGSTVSAVDASIAGFCKQTSYPDVCMSSVKPYLPASGHLSPADMLLMQIKATATKVASATAHANQLLAGTTITPYLRSCLETCKDLYDDMNANFDDAKKSLAASDLDTLKTMLSATISDASTCEDGFLEMPGVPMLMGSFDSELSKLTSNCLALADLV